jgi:hypothetical protein
MLNKVNKAPFLDVDGIYPVLKVYYPGGRPARLVAVTDTFRCHDNMFLVEGYVLGLEYGDDQVILDDPTTLLNQSYFAQGDVPLSALEQGVFYVRN